MKVALHVGHHGPGTGASCDGRDEVLIATRHAEIVQLELIRAGHEVTFYPSSPLRYSEVHARVNADRAVNLYIQFHVNSANGINEGNDHGLIFYDHRSKVGPVAASKIAALASRAGLMMRAHTDDPVKGYPRVHPCIAGVRVPALLFEPHFIQVDRNPDDIGLRLAGGLLGWIG